MVVVVVVIVAARAVIGSQRTVTYLEPLAYRLAMTRRVGKYFRKFSELFRHPGGATFGLVSSALFLRDF